MEEEGDVAEEQSTHVRIVGGGRKRCDAYAAAERCSTSVDENAGLGVAVTLPGGENNGGREGGEERATTVRWRRRRRRREMCLIGEGAAQVGDLGVSGLVEGLDRFFQRLLVEIQLRFSE